MALAFRVDGEIASTWCFPSILACYCMLGRHTAVVANLVILVLAIPMMWSTLDNVVSARLTASLVAVSLFANILVREIDAQQEKLKYQLDHDPLTGLLNRMSLKQELQRAVDAFRDRLLPSTLLALDLDHFKSVNERYGHDTGDLVLCEVTRLLKQHTAGDGAVFRLGREEFMVLLTELDEGSARRRAELLRLMIAKTAILQSHRVTLSIDMASLCASDDAASWASRSDERLCAAKRGGRNRVVSDREVDLEELPVANRAAADKSAADTSAGTVADTSSSKIL